MKAVVLKACLCLLVATGRPSVADYAIDWFTIDGGGAMWTTGGDFALCGTIGQPDVGVAMAGGGFELLGGFVPAGSGASPTCIGDLNCDGLINFGDINPFVLYLSNEANWQATYTGCARENGDINCDGTMGTGSFQDINPFVTLIIQCGGGCACPGPITCP